MEIDSFGQKEKAAPVAALERERSYEKHNSICPKGRDAYLYKGNNC